MKNYGQMTDHATRRRRNKPQAVRRQPEPLWVSALAGVLGIIGCIAWAFILLLLTV